jgi:hypothetical protein
MGAFVGAVAQAMVALARSVIKSTFAMVLVMVSLRFGWMKMNTFSSIFQLSIP